MTACKKLQRYCSTTDTFGDKIRRDFACLMLPGPLPAVKHIWPHTRLQHARENVAAYPCSYPSKQLSSTSSPPQSSSESTAWGCPSGQSQPQALQQEPQHWGTPQKAADCPKCSASTTFKSPKKPPTRSPSSLFLLYFPQLWNIFSLLSSHMVSDMEERVPSGSCF